MDYNNPEKTNKNSDSDSYDKKNKIQEKHLQKLDEFIQNCLNKFYFIDPLQSFYDRTGKDKDLIISHKSTIPDLVIWNKTFNKGECFEGANLKIERPFPRYRFYLRLNKDKNIKGKNNKDKEKKNKKNKKKNKKNKNKNNTNKENNETNTNNEINEENNEENNDNNNDNDNEIYEKQNIEEDLSKKINNLDIKDNTNNKNINFEYNNRNNKVNIERDKNNLINFNKQQQGHNNNIIEPLNKFNISQNNENKMYFNKYNNMKNMKNELYQPQMNNNNKYNNYLNQPNMNYNNNKFSINNYNNYNNYVNEINRGEKKEEMTQAEFLYNLVYKYINKNGWLIITQDNENKPNILALTNSFDLYNFLKEQFKNNNLNSFIIYLLF